MQIGRKELVDRLSERHPEMTKGQIEKLLLSVLDEMADAIQSGHDIKLAPYLGLNIVNRQARTMRKPGTAGGVLNVPAKRTLKMRAFTKFRPPVAASS